MRTVTETYNVYNYNELSEEAKEKAKQAMDDFDYASDMLEIKTKKQINLYGGTATSEVVDIAAESRDICDNIYISLQSSQKGV